MIKRATSKDSRRLVEIENLVFKSPLSQSFLNQELSDNPFAYYYVYQIEGRIIAYIGFRVVDQSAEMMNFCVVPKQQRKQYGSKLFSFALKELNNLGVKKITLEVRRSNEVANKFYQKAGFSQLHIRKNYYQTEDAIIYIKEAT